MIHKARKRFGQNFLQDRSVIDRIIGAINPLPGDRLVEIGPGLGAITLPLLNASSRLQAVELDRDLIEPLAAKCAGVGELEIHGADALNFDFARLGGGPDGLRLVGNLPYNISTPLLFHLLRQNVPIKDMHFMLQKEVVQRMAAEPGGKDYGRLTVMLQSRCEVDHLFDIGPESFDPPPRVVSAFVRLQPYSRPPYPIADFDCFSQLVASAFAHRRKTLRNNLKGLCDVERIESCGIDPGARAETLSLEQFARLANGILRVN